MKGKIVKNAIDSVVNALSTKNTEEVKKYSRNKLLKSVPLFISGGILHYMDSTNVDPLGVLDVFNSYNIAPNNAYMGLYVLGSAFLLSNGDGEAPLQEELAQYGSEYCPYESYTVAYNDLKAKSIQMKINNLHNTSYKLGGKSFLGKATKKIANGAEYITTKAGRNTKKVLDFFGKGEFGFELLAHNKNNPRLVKELPVSQGLKDMLSPETLDIDNQYKIEERKLVFEVRERAMSKSKEEIIERNIILSLVKLIDKAKKETLKIQDIKILEKIKKISKTASVGNIKKYETISLLANELTKEGDLSLENLKNLDVLGLDLEQSLHERSFHILNFLNKHSYKNNYKPLKKPMTYKEIYRNNLVMAIQFKLRSKYEFENLKIQEKSPLIKEHFLNTHKKYYQSLDKFKAIILLGTKISDYPSIDFLNKKEDEVLKTSNINNIKNKIRN
jgi:hypothetical protein